MFVFVYRNMGSAGHEIILENTVPVNMLEEKVAAAVSVLESDQLEDNKKTQSEAASERSTDGVKSDGVKSDQTAESKSKTNRINEPVESKPAASMHQQFDLNVGSSATTIDARDDADKLRKGNKIKNVVDNGPQHADSDPAVNSSANTNRDAPVATILPGIAELQTSTSQSSVSGLTSDNAVGPGFVGKSIVRKSGGGQEYGEVTTAPYQRRSIVLRARGSGGHLQSTSESGSAYNTPAVTAEEQYSFRYRRLCMIVSLSML